VTIQILTVTFLLIHGHNVTTGAGRAIVRETCLGLLLNTRPVFTARITIAWSVYHLAKIT